MTMKLFVCREPRESHWQIGSKPDGSHALLLGWRTRTQDVDGGVPRVVAGLLAQALASTGKVTFATGSHTVRRIVEPSDESVDLSRTGLLKRATAAIQNEPQSLVLIGTSRVETIVNAFSDATFSWEMGVQRLLLSTPASSGLPSREAWLRLMRDDAEATRELLTQEGTLGFMRPGVDGAVATLYSKTLTTESAFIEALANAASGAGAGYELLTEGAFVNALADARHATR